MTDMLDTIWEDRQKVIAGTAALSAAAPIQGDALDRIWDTQAAGRDSFAEIRDARTKQDYEDTQKQLAITAEVPQLVPGPELGILSRAKQWIRERTGYFEPPIYSGPQYREEHPVRTIVGAGAYYGAELVNGLGLNIPDILAGPLKGADSLSSAVNQLTGFQPTPREISAGEVVEFASGLRTAGKISKVLVNRIAARESLKRILTVGLQFSGRQLSDEVAQKIINHDPIDLQAVWAQGGVGVLFGISEVALAWGVEKWTARRLANEYVKRIPGLERISQADRVRTAEAAIDTWKVKAGEMTPDEWHTKHWDHLQKFSDRLRDLSVKETAKTFLPKTEGAGAKTLAAPHPSGPVEITESGLQWVGELRQRLAQGEPLAAAELDFLREVGVDPQAELQAMVERQAAQEVQRAAETTTKEAQAPARVVEAGAVAESAAVAGGAAASQERTPEEIALLTQAVQAYASGLEGSPDRLGVYSGYLTDLAQTSTFREKGLGGFDVPTQRVMMKSMLADLHQPEIRDFVVEFIPVDVVDALVRVEPSSEMSLHDKSMFGGAPVVKTQDTVSLLRDVADSLLRVLASRTTTGIGNFNEGRPAAEGLSTYGAQEGKRHIGTPGTGLGTTLSSKTGEIKTISPISGPAGPTTVQGGATPEGPAQPEREQWEVVLEEPTIIGGRQKPDLVEHRYTVQAKTAKQAEKAVRDAGHKGRLVSTQAIQQPAPAPKPAEIVPPGERGESQPAGAPGPSTILGTGKGMRPGFAGAGAPEGMAGVNVPPIVVDEQDLREPLPEVEFKEYPKDLGWIAENINTLSAAAAATNNPTVIKVANELVDVPLVLREEVQRRIQDSDAQYAKLPTEYRADRGEKFMELMDRELSPAQIDADTEIPEAVKPILKYFKQVEEDIRLAIIQQKRGMAKAMHLHQTTAQLVDAAKERGLNWESRGREIGGLKVESVYDTDSETFLNKEQVALQLAEADIPDSWGRQWAHIQHIFFGQYKLKVLDAKGKPHFIGTAETQAEAVDKLLTWSEQKKADGESLAGVRLTVDRDFHMPYDVARLSAAQYYHVQKSLKDALQAERGEIEDATRGIIGKKASKQKFWGALLQRKGAEGFSMDFQRVWRTSITQYVRWKRLSEMNAKVTPMIEDLRAEGLPGWADHLEFWRDNVMGRKRSTAATWLDDRLARVPGLGQHVKPFLLERMASAIKTVNYFRHLQTLRFYVVNSLQPLQTLWPVVGEKGFLRAVKRYYSKEGQDILHTYGIETETKFKETGLIAAKKTKGWSPAALSERRNQGLAFLALYDQGKRLGMPEGAAAQYARLRGQVFTQFAFSPADVPKFMRGNLGGLVFQYKRFTVKNIELVFRLLHEGSYGGVARWVTALLGVGGASVFLRITAGLPMVGFLTYKAYKWVEEHYGKDTADVLHHGLPGLVGIDVSGSVTPVDVPYGETVAEKVGTLVLGPTGQTIQRLVTDLRNTDIAKDTGVLSRGLQSLVDASPTFKQFSYLIKALRQDTSNLDSKQREAYQLEVADLWKKALGFMPETEALQRMQIAAMLDVKERYDKQLDRIALARLAGDDEEAARLIVQWNALWPEAPIGVNDANQRVKGRRQSAQETKTQRTYEVLPKKIRRVFPEVKQ